MSKTELYFKVNDYITLKYENDGTNIYVRGKLFRQCKYLLLNIEKDKIAEYDDINSIDEAVEIHKKLYKKETNMKIDSKSEFIGHCSNIQAWYENDYDTRILHSNLSFPLLKELSNFDLKAKRKFKEEIALRIEEGNVNTIPFLMSRVYLSNFSSEELDVITKNIKYDNDYKSYEILEKLYYNGSKEALNIMIDRLIDGKTEYPEITYGMLLKLDEGKLEIIYDKLSKKDDLHSSLYVICLIYSLVNDKKKKIIKNFVYESLMKDIRLYKYVSRKIIDNFLLSLNLEQLQNLFNKISNDEQVLLREINNIMTKKWLLTKNKRVTHRKEQILDFKYENE